MSFDLEEEEEKEKSDLSHDCQGSPLQSNDRVFSVPTAPMHLLLTGSGGAHNPPSVRGSIFNDFNGGGNIPPGIRGSIFSAGGHKSPLAFTGGPIYSNAGGWNSSPVGGASGPLYNIDLGAVHSGGQQQQENGVVGGGSVLFHDEDVDPAHPAPGPGGVVSGMTVGRLATKRANAATTYSQKVLLPRRTAGLMITIEEKCLDIR